MSNASLLAKNTLLIAVSRISSQLIIFLMLPIYTTLLSPEEYGAVDLVITYGGLVAPLIMLNVQQAIFRYLIDARSDKEVQSRVITNAAEITMTVSLLAAAVYFFASYFVNIPFATIMVFYFASFIIGDLVLQIARGLGHTKAFAIAGISQGFLTVILNIVFMLLLQMGPDGMLLGMALGLLVPAIVLAATIGVHHSVKLSSRDHATKRQLLRFSLPLMPNSISWWMFNASDRTIISLVLGVAANGIYAVTNRFASIANNFSAIFYASWSESAVLAIDDPGRDEFFSKVANMMLKVFGTLGILIMSFTPLIFPFLVNNEFNEALLYLPILILGTVLNTIVSFYSAIYIAKELTKQVTNTSLVAAFINLFVCLGLVLFIGIWAAAISTAVAYGVMAIYRHYDIKKYMKITYEHGIFIRLGLLYAIVSILYYTNAVWASVTGVIISVIAGYVINRHELGRIRELLLGQPRG